MNATRARLAAIIASFLVAQLVTWGLVEASPELSTALERWVNHSFELILLLGYAVVHPWIQKRSNPTGAMTGDAARRLEAAAHMEGR